MKTIRSTEDYLISVLDSDGDEVLTDASIRAVDYPTAWQQAVVTAFRTCHGSGAAPMTITVVRVKEGAKLSGTNRGRMEREESNKPPSVLL
jgi:hypothetical protein